MGRAGYYRQQRAAAQPRPRDGGRQPRALSASERQAVLDVLHRARFRDAAPAAVYATLWDAGTYWCSERSRDRLLAAAQAVRERRDQPRHPASTRPELLATRPNARWSWDSTQLLGPTQWTCCSRSVSLDVCSRSVVGWTLCPRETAELAQDCSGETLANQQIDPDTLTLHADRGSSMTSTPVACLLADLGITTSHARPQVSNDNPYSASQFTTLTYRPAFPARFASLEEARAFCQTFFAWYNTEHHHRGIGLHTPEAMHYGLAEARHVRRSATLTRASTAHPDRFVRQPPTPPALPTAVWINKPAAPPREQVAAMSQPNLP